MIKISFIYPFYNNIDCVKKRLNNWGSFNKDLLKELQFILIDDYSDNILDKCYFDQFNLNLKVARIETDIMWNQSGAHNLGSQLASGEWLFMMDIDHWIDEKSTLYLCRSNKNKSSSYFFNRIYMEKFLASAPNIYLITKEKFWSLGGYDEDFAGCYGYEDKLLNKIIRDYTISELSSIQVRVDNAPTQNLDRTRDRNKLLLNKKMSEYYSNNYKNGKILRFKWKIIIEKELV
jgi:hypothetical protein